MHWLLVGYMWLYIHRPFEVWPVLADLRVERIYMLATLTMWLVVADKGWVRSRLTPAFGLLFAVLLLAWLASPYGQLGTKVIEDYAKVGVFYVLVMSCVRDEKTLRFLVVGFLVCTALYMTHSLVEYRNGRHVYRMGTARMVGVDGTLADPNSFAASLIYALPLVLPVWFAATKPRRDKALVAAYVALTAACVLLTGSRTGLMGLVVAMLAYAVLSRYRFRILVAMAVLIPLVWGVLPQDRQDRFMTLIDPSRGPENAQASADSREELFRVAVELWQQSPILGFGPNTFATVSGTGQQAHTLYGQVLAETGSLGALALLGVVASFVLTFVNVSRAHRGVPWSSRGFAPWLSVGVFATVGLLLLLGVGGHNLYRHTWLWYAAFLSVALHCVRSDVHAWQGQSSDPVALDSPEPFGALAIYPVASSAR